MSTTRVRPALQFDVSVVRDDIHILGRNDGRRNRHVLNREAVAVHGILFANLRSIVKVLLSLDGCLAGIRDAADLVQPLAASGTDVTEDNGAEGKTVQLG